eukprot:3257285-Rhodomonas_salina.2
MLLAPVLLHLQPREARLCLRGTRPLLRLLHQALARSVLFSPTIFHSLPRWLALRAHLQPPSPRVPRSLTQTLSPTPPLRRPDPNSRPIAAVQWDSQLRMTACATSTGPTKRRSTSASVTSMTWYAPHPIYLCWHICAAIATHGQE